MASRTEEIVSSQNAEKECRRLFVLGCKEVTAEELQECFEKFGTLTELKKTFDKNGEDRGIVYVSYSKTSEACLAVEEMDGQSPPGKSTRRMKVNFSTNARESPKGTETTMNKLFLRVRKDMTESALRSDFQQFGEIQNVHILKDKNTRESRGLAFVTFVRKHSAAKALEDCNSDYHARFSESKRMEEHAPAQAFGSGRYARKANGPGGNPEMSEYPDFNAYDGFGSMSRAYDPLLPPPIPRSPYEDFEGLSGSRGYKSVEYMIENDPMNKNNRNQCAVDVKGCQCMTERQVYRVFDIIPGLKTCKLDSVTGTAVVRYESPECASHAVEKINNLEYPPGVITCELQPVLSTGVATAAEQLKESVKSLMSGNADINSLVGTIQKATEALQHAGLAQNDTEAFERVRWCSVPLPRRKPMSRASIAEKLFIHFMVDPRMGSRFDLPPSFSTMVSDAFCRFGNLINVSVLKGKNIGFAQYADTESAERAKQTLDGEMLGGIASLKVMLADNFKDRDSKRESAADDMGDAAKRSKNEYEYNPNEYSQALA